LSCFSWGAIGHRVVGEIAWSHLNPQAKKKLKKLLGNESLAMTGTYMDFIRSERKYDHMSPWHYCTIPDDQTYEEAGTPEKGDAIVTIQRLMKELERKKFTDEDELFAVKMLVHLVGDIHQPLHVGNGEDRGGNDVKLEFFWKNSNLHRVWDEGIIDEQKLSYTEYTAWINFATEDQVRQWQSDDLMVWVNESKSYREVIYDLPENKKINYRYVHDHIDLLNQRLLQAGVRLAGYLNQIYGA
ncbi:MAG: S1/P1 nuclease, partial [Bacteroidota bacterium]